VVTDADDDNDNAECQSTITRVTYHQLIAKHLVFGTPCMPKSCKKRLILFLDWRSYKVTKRSGVVVVVVVIIVPHAGVCNCLCLSVL